MALINSVRNTLLNLAPVQAIATSLKRLVSGKHRSGPHKAGAITVLAILLSGCAGVKIATVSTEDYIAQRRGDILTTNKLSASARDTLTSLAIAPEQCAKDIPHCSSRLTELWNLDTEQRMATLAEIWTQEALRLQGRRNARPDFSTELFDAYLQSARYAYAYLFFTDRRPGDRAFEDRQTQVRDYYNYAVQQATMLLFAKYHDTSYAFQKTIEIGRWRIRGDLSQVRDATAPQPHELIPASQLTFRGVRSIYRRDGFGAEMVVVNESKDVTPNSFQSTYSEPPFQAVTGIITFPGETLSQVLQTRDATIIGYDPYQQTSVRLKDVQVPLAANYTSAYGLWLARSDFSTQALRTVLGRDGGIESPHVFLLQPYDPNRRVIIMLHGLASSPEAWINVANEVLGDEELRDRYQIWQVYYPTNLPLPYNNAEIRKALTETFRHFDPDRKAIASNNIVVIGHSMGGVLGRLLVSSSDNLLEDAARDRYQMDDVSIAKMNQEFGNVVHFSPLPGVTTAIFIAAPHKGTPFAGNRISRLAAALITLPVTVVTQLNKLSQVAVGNTPAKDEMLILPNGVESLRDSDPFMQITSKMPISTQVRYHSIIANDTPKKDLLYSDDGLVPYQSSHLPGATSELVIPFSHSVQETPEAILEIRRILREQ